MGGWKVANCAEEEREERIDIVGAAKEGGWDAGHSDIWISQLDDF